MNCQAQDPDYDKLMEIVGSDEVKRHFGNINAFKVSIRAGSLGKTAKFWMQYIDIIHLILIFI